MGRRKLAIWVVSGAVTLCCQSAGDLDLGNGSAAVTSSGGHGDSAGHQTAAASMSEPGEGGSESSSGEGGQSGNAGECILWANECTPEQKCMPWSLNGDQIPDEIRCCPAPDAIDLPGQPCSAADYNGSCIDTCQRGSMCVIDGGEALTGTCQKFCEPAGAPCLPNQTCKPFFELLPNVPTVPLCMDQCDPLTQDCATPGWQCIPDSPTLAGQSGFICVPPPPEMPVAALQPCALANQCSPGLVCILSSRLPGCAAGSCCTALCPLSEGDAPCAGIHPDLTCVDWMSPDPTWSDVGVCAMAG